MSYASAMREMREDVKERMRVESDRMHGVRSCRIRSQLTEGDIRRECEAKGVPITAHPGTAWHLCECGNFHMNDGYEQFRSPLGWTTRKVLGEGLMKRVRGVPPGSMGFIGTGRGLTRPMAETHPFVVPMSRINPPKPYPCEAPPEPYYTTVTNAVGMRFRALVVPLPVREVGIGGTLPETISGEHIRHLAMLAVDRAR
jgi:hypothetical protein